MPAESNQEVYESSDVVQSYTHDNRLTRAEQLLLKQYQEDYAGRIVMDLGVGGGRTTPYLAAPANEYCGVDYSSAMVQACRKRYGSYENARFVQDDARNLTTCPAARFDTVFFSFNGIDVVDFAGRGQVLDAVCRVLKPAGIFVFSFHNAGTLDALYSYHWQKNPLRWMPNLRRLQQIKKLNGPSDQYRNQNYFFLRDGGEVFRLDICYVKPSFQIEQLVNHGFEVLQAFESESGKELSLQQVDQSKSSWIYYRCRKK